MFNLNKSSDKEDKPEQLQKPIIVSGTGRSGTSILLGAIAAHPNVHNRPNEKGEAPFITHFLRFLVEIDNAPYADYVNRNYRCGDEKKNKLFINLLRDINSPTASQYDVDYWPAKISINEEQYNKLKELTEGFPLIKIHRNPISVIDSSLNFHGFQHLSFEDICNRWVKGNSNLNFFRNQDRTYVVAYEDLVSQPEETFKAIFEKLEIEQSDKPAKFFKKTKINSAYKSQKKPSVEERWNSWSKKQQEMCKEICGDLMADLGYKIPKP